MMSSFSLVGAGLGLLLAIYANVFLHVNTNTNVEIESTRVINTLTSIIRGEFNQLNTIQSVHDDNPYDLFTRIYPTLKDMNNEQIQEFINVIENYNDNWISNDD